MNRRLRIWRQRLRSMSEKDEMDQELGDELSFHFEQLVRENAAEGMSPEDARHAARRALGNMALLEEQCRDHRRVMWIHDLWHDLLFGARMLRKNPGFTAIAVASLALGIGANTAVLGVMDAVMLGQLPYSNADRLVLLRMYPVENPGQNGNATIPDYLAWKDQTTAFEAMGASINDQKDFGLEENGTPPERYMGVGFSPQLFQTLGVQPMMGRLFTEEEDRIDQPAPVMLISYRLWQERFAGDPNILGKQVIANGVNTSIIGVMPRGFSYPDADRDYWVPLPLNRFQLEGSARFYMVTARLRTGATVQQAQVDLERVAARLARDFPDRQKGLGVRVQPMRDARYGWTKMPLLTLEAAVALVLLIACANVAGLLLARGAVRRPEIAMRVALGAGRGRIIRQFLTESVLLSLVGGVLGILVAWWGLPALQAIAPPVGGTQIGAISLNARMLGLTALISVVSGLIFGVAPALAGLKPDVSGALKESSRGAAAGSGGGRHGLRGALVTAQIGSALVLLIGTGLLLHSFLRLAGRDINFDPQGLLTFSFRIPIEQYLHTLGSYRGVAYAEVNPPPAPTMERIYERLRALPGAESVAGISYPPVNSLVLPTMSFAIEGRPLPETDSDRRAMSADYFLITPNFFATMRTPFLRGRDFDEHDSVSSTWVAIINETMAHKFWPGEDPIGKRFTLDVVSGEQPREIVGIVRDIPVRSAFNDSTAVIYTSYLQQAPRYRGPSGNMFGQMMFLIRNSSDPLILAAGARSAVAEIEPDRPLGDMKTMEQTVGGPILQRRYYLLVVGVFAFAATVLAAIGIYGVMAYTVAQRTHEIGVRMALGASAEQVIALVGRRALALIAGGLALGLTGSLALTRLIASQLWGVTPTDPATFAGVSLLLTVVALLACFVPARRAVRVDPTVALRSE